MADLGNFLANMLLGGLEEGQRRRQSREEQQQKLLDIYATAKAKSLFPDPLTAILLGIYGKGATGLGGQGGPSGVPSDEDRRAILGLPPTTAILAARKGAEKEAELKAELAVDPEKFRREKIGATKTLLGSFRDLQSLGPQPGVVKKLFTGTPSAISPEVAQALQRQLQEEVGTVPPSLGASDDQFARDIQNAQRAVRQGAPLKAVKQKLSGRHKSRVQDIERVFPE